MSHVTSIKDFDLRDLDALSTAVSADLDGELVRGVTSFRYWAGKSEPCEHVIRFKGCRAEVGIRRAADGKAGWVLAWDSMLLTGRLGRDAGKLKQAYAVELTRRELNRQGCRVTVTRDATTGRVVVQGAGGRPIGGAR